MSKARKPSPRSGRRAGRANSSRKPQRSFRQQSPAGLNKDLRTRDDVGIGSVFAPVMTDATDRRYEQHAGRHDRGKNLGVMTGAAGHADRLAAGKLQARVFDGLLESGIRHDRGAGANPLHLDSAAALGADLRGHLPQVILQALDHGRVVVAHLKQQFGTSRDDAVRAGIEGDAAGGPYRTWTTPRR